MIYLENSAKVNMTDDCIILTDDDEEVQVLDQFYNIEPIVIDLTGGYKCRKSDKQNNSQKTPGPTLHRPEDKQSEQPYQPQQPETEQQESNHTNQSQPRSPEPTQQHHHRTNYQTHHPSQESCQQQTQQQYSTSQNQYSTPQQPLSPQRSQTPIQQSQERPQPSTPSQHQQHPNQHQSQQQQPQQPQPPNHQPHQPQVHTAQKSQEPTPLRPQPTQQPQENHNNLSNGVNHIQRNSPPKRTIEDDRQLMLKQKELGNTLFRRMDFNEAKNVYQRANKLAMQLNDLDISSKLHFNIAMTYECLGQYDRALEEFAQATKLNRDYKKAHLKRALIYDKQNKLDEALVCWEHLHEMYKDDMDIARQLHRAKERAMRQIRRKDHEILGLTYSFVSQADLKKALREKRLAHHPDRHMDADEVTRKIEGKKFMDANEAYKNIVSRMRYDF